MGKITIEIEIKTFGKPLYGLSHPNLIYCDIHVRVSTKKGQLYYIILCKCRLYNICFYVNCHLVVLWTVEAKHEKGNKCIILQGNSRKAFLSPIKNSKCPIDHHRCFALTTAIPPKSHNETQTIYGAKMCKKCRRHWRDSRSTIAQGALNMNKNSAITKMVDMSDNL